MGKICFYKIRFCSTTTARRLCRFTLLATCRKDILLLFYFVLKVHITYNKNTILLYTIGKKIKKKSAPTLSRCKLCLHDTPHILLNISPKEHTDLETQHDAGTNFWTMLKAIKGLGSPCGRLPLDGHPIHKFF